MCVMGSSMGEFMPYAGGKMNEGHTTLTLTTGETSGLSMSRISGGHSTMKQGVRICCEIYLTLLNITMKGASKRKISRRKRVGGSTFATFNCFVFVWIVITEQIKANMIIKNSYINEESVYGDDDDDYYFAHI